MTAPEPGGHWSAALGLMPKAEAVLAVPMPTLAARLGQEERSPSTAASPQVSGQSHHVLQEGCKGGEDLLQVWWSLVWLLFAISGKFKDEECFQQGRRRERILMENILSHSRNFQ